MNELKYTHRKKKKFKPESIFFFVIIIYGIMAAFIIFPLSNGDEGFHLSRSYQILSKVEPKSMDEEHLRSLEIDATMFNKKFDTYSFYHTKLADVKDDGISFHLKYDSNLILKLDLAHLPAACGTVVERLIYPSYGVILTCARLFNLIFFSIAMYFIIKFSKVGKWSLFMLFTIPCMQKIASPSYDVYAYVTLAAYGINLLRIAKFRAFREIPSSLKIYTIITIFLLLFSKNNYLFALFPIIGLPVIINPVRKRFNEFHPNYKKILSFFLLLVIIFLMALLNKVLNLPRFFTTLFHSYVDVSTADGKAQYLFSVVPDILPQLLNIIWIICLLFVLLGELAQTWNVFFYRVANLSFFINWIGIFTGFYLIHGKPNQAITELSGRYLHPFLIFFIPWIQTIGFRLKIKITNNSLSKIAIFSSVFILLMYLIFTYYRGYQLHITPTWVN